MMYCSIVDRIFSFIISGELISKWILIQKKDGNNIEKVYSRYYTYELHINVHYWSKVKLKTFVILQNIYFI